MYPCHDMHVFPYTDNHSANLDWLMKEFHCMKCNVAHLKKLAEMLENISPSGEIFKSVQAGTYAGKWTLTNSFDSYNVDGTVLKIGEYVNESEILIEDVEKEKSVCDAVFVGRVYDVLIPYVTASTDGHKVFIRLITPITPGLETGGCVKWSVKEYAGQESK